VQRRVTAVAPDRCRSQPVGAIYQPCRSTHGPPSTVTRYTVQPPRSSNERSALIPAPVAYLSFNGDLDARTTIPALTCVSPAPRLPLGNGRGWGPTASCTKLRAFHLVNGPLVKYRYPISCQHGKQGHGHVISVNSSEV
jgi:hypothetical protein